MELFWRGMRDFHHPNGLKGMDVADFALRYDRLFGPEGNTDLRNAIRSFKHLDGLPFKCLQDHNYVAKGHIRILCNNLFYPEIDVVLESPGFLYIGEAKYESGFSTDAPYLLVHQLVREYVMASVLLDRIGSVKIGRSICRLGYDSRRQAASPSFVHETIWPETAAME